MGLSNKTTKTTQTQNQNTTMNTMPVNPSWVTGGLESLGTRLSDTFKSFDPSKLTPGPNPLQTQAAGLASGLGALTKPYEDALSTFNGMRNSQANTYDPTTGQAVTREATTGSAVTGQAASLLDNLGAYMSPYTKDVVDAALADNDYNAGKVRAQQKLDLANDAAFGGSGGSLLRSFTEGELSRGRDALSAGLRDEAFKTGAALSSQDADRRQGMTLANLGAQNTFGLANMDAINTQGRANQDAQNTFGLKNMDAINTAGQFNAGQRDNAATRQLAGASGLVSTANSQQDQQRQNITSQSQLGEMLRAIDADQGMAPLKALLMEAGIWQTLPLDLLRGSDSTGTLTGTTKGTSKESGAGLGDWLNFFASNAQAAAAGMKGG